MYRCSTDWSFGQKSPSRRKAFDLMLEVLPDREVARWLNTGTVWAHVGDDVYEVRGSTTIIHLNSGDMYCCEWDRRKCPAKGNLPVEDTIVGRYLLITANTKEFLRVRRRNSSGGYMRACYSYNISMGANKSGLRRQYDARKGPPIERW